VTPGASRAAIEYGAALRIRDASRLTRRLYAFGRYPLSPRLRSTFPDPETVRDHLFHEDEPVRRLLTSEWRRRRFSGEDPGWALWTRRQEDPGRALITHKLYVSPVLERIRSAFHAVIPIVTGSEAVSFKIGAELSYLARSDKLVVYFCSYAAMLRVARQLQPALADFGAHGVPFTCPIDEGGLLSWGMDPPGDTQTSWRLWLAQRLARAMTEAPPEEQVDAALQRAKLLGVDPVTWEPRDVVWDGDGSD